MCMTIYNTLDTGALIGLDNSNIYISQTVLLNWTVRLAIQCVGLVLYSGVWLMDTPEISHTVMSASLSYTHTNYLVTRGHFPWVCILWPLETPKENWGLLQTNRSGILRCFGLATVQEQTKIGFYGEEVYKKPVLFKGKALFQCA